MKIQGLAIIAIIIILPMTILLSSYARNQIKTLDLQIQYDTKLQNATYDAIKAFQLNMSNSSTSDLANSKMRDIKASINTFYNSLTSHFNMSGYTKNVLQNYTPAVVYTLYDGYYIYSAYNNELDDEDTFDDLAEFKDGETIYGLKPYIYYSCRYKPNSNSDFTIIYSLDSYITIQGIINGKNVNESGYLLSSVDKNVAGNYTYRGVEIKEENNKEGLKQNVYVEYKQGGQQASGNKRIVKPSTGEILGNILKYPCQKINGVKYYQESNDKVFAIINDVKYDQSDVTNITNNKNGIKYYEDAYNFKNKIKDLGLTNLKASDAVDSNGKKYSNYPKEEDNPFTNYNIFEELFSSTKNIEDKDSNFNAHKMQVIKNSIESNLIPAISNYNKVSITDVNFAMPKLQEYEWEQIAQNVSMITFLQGLNIGGKIYNGYSIVSNDNTEDFVPEDSIYILTGVANAGELGEYHQVTEDGLENKINNNTVGIFKADFERRATVAESKLNNGEDEYSTPVYYYPREDIASYTSIINANEKNSGKNVYDYFKNVGQNPSSNLYKLAQIYYTALGRERYGMYRVTNKLEDVQNQLVSQGN